MKTKVHLQSDGYYWANKSRKPAKNGHKDFTPRPEWVIEARNRIIDRAKQTPRNCGDGFPAGCIFLSGIIGGLAIIISIIGMILGWW